MARTYLDIWFTGFNGVVVRSIVSKDWNLFVKNAIILFGVMMWPMSFTNNSLKLVINKLALAFRTRLTHYAHNQYLDGITFYKVTNLDNRIQNIDQLLTQDIEKFSDSLIHLYSDIAKPLVDIGLFAYKLGESVGAEAPVWMLSYFLTTGLLLRTISPPFGKYVAIEQALEGDFRYSHSRVITHAEEIAFYNGGDREKQIVNSSFQRIVNHLNKVFLLRFGNGIIDSVLVKYCATMLAFVVLSRPVFGPKAGSGPQNADPTKIMEDYSRNSGYLINLSQSVGRIVLAGRDLTRFAGFTSRVADLLEVLQDVSRGRYQRAMISKDTTGINDIKTVDIALLKGEAKVVEDGTISFEGVPVATPNGDILLESLTLKLRRGMNCLITGPNGCGKSSLFRILGGLWPLFDGKMAKPTQRNMFYVPQKPYLPLGTLRDQVVYPDSQDKMLEQGRSDADLLEMLKVVHLEYLVEREGGWDAVRDWADVLSGGEKQRIAMARLFYHKPQFAILDECTSAVSIDVEGEMYMNAKEIGITLFTVSHRPSLFPYHDYLLRFDGQGHYDFEELDHSDPNPLKHPFAFGQPSGLGSRKDTQPLSISGIFAEDSE